MHDLSEKADFLQGSVVHFQSFLHKLQLMRRGMLWSDIHTISIQWRDHCTIFVDTSFCVPWLQEIVNCAKIVYLLFRTKVGMDIQHLLANSLLQLLRSICCSLTIAACEHQAKFAIFWMLPSIFCIRWLCHFPRGSDNVSYLLQPPFQLRLISHVAGNGVHLTFTCAPLCQEWSKHHTTVGF